MAAAEGTVIACHTMEEFEAQLDKGNETGKLVVIDFMSPTCGPCLQIAPVFAECAKKYPTKGVFLKVDITELDELASYYNIEGTPTFYFIWRTMTLESFFGAYPDKLRNTVKEFIEEYIPDNAPSA